MRSMLVFVAALLTVACVPEDTDGTDTDGTDTDVPLLAEGFEDGLTNTVSCSDTSFDAWDAEGTVGLHLSVSGLLGRADADADGHYEETVTLGASGAATLTVDVGTDVHINYCTDALSELQIDETWTATSGTASLTVDAGLDGADPTGLVVLSDVVLSDGAGHEIALDALTLGPVQILRNWGG